MEEAERNLLSAFDKSKRTEHKGLKGDARARTIADFLGRRLPSGYGVLCKGEIVDYRDKRSGEIDILIFDKVRNSVLSDDPLWITAEALLAYIEVKSVLTEEELVNAFRAAKRINALRPFKRSFTLAGGEGDIASDQQTHASSLEHTELLRCFRTLFAYSTNLTDNDWLNQEWNRVLKAAKDVQCSPACLDRIIVLNRGMINAPHAIGTDQFDVSSVFQQWFINLANFLVRENGRRDPTDWQLYTKKVPGWRTLAK